MLAIKRDIRDIRRFEQIASVLLKNGLGYYLQKISPGAGRAKEPQREEIARKLKISFEELGGAFVKLGQLLSLRPDLIPQEFCSEFSEMQDSMPPFPYEEAKQIIEAELRRPLKEIFSSFGKKPIAAASIGQVHRARLVSGEDVVIKVQRPHVKEQFESDIDILYFLARIIESHFHTSLFSPSLIVREFESYTEKEMDYIDEAKNLEAVHKNFSGNPCRIPRPYREYTTSRVLCMEYINGTKLSRYDKSPEEKKAVAGRIADAVFKQVFEDGVFHADPHPGNIIVLEDGNIALIDFGITGYISDSLREKLTDLFVSAVNKDISGIASSLTEIGIVKRAVDTEVLKQDIAEKFGDYYNAQLKEIKMSGIFSSVIYLCKKHKIKLPVNFILLSKCAVTTESVIQVLDPHFNPIEKAKPFVEKLIARRYGPKGVIRDFRKGTRKLTSFILGLPEMTSEAMQTMYKGERYVRMIHRDMNMLTVEMDRSSNRIALSLIITALIIASAYLTNVTQNMLFGFPMLSLIGFVAAVVLSFALVASVIGEKRNI